ncbi:hypothetical protein [Saccharomonospora sp. NB11]|uniref:hypothetical protein n=1 Tax=Saccharomonospora sp. NB11 TaxID=1642298 RepID=UPI0018D02A70|nr:hypothetical protein [Saccharomonospora sp. NB11]
MSRTLRTLGVSVAVLLVLLGSTPAHARQTTDELATLDVAAVLADFAANRIHRAPGAIATFDEELISGELTDEFRLLVTPTLSADSGLDEVEEWVDRNGHTLIHVEGLLVTSTADYVRGPADLPALRQHTAAHDVTNQLWKAVHYPTLRRNEPSPHPPLDVVSPTRSQTAALVEQLTDERIVNAPGRTDPIDVTAEEFTRRTGFTVRVAAFPPVAPGEALVDHAPALAEHFPDDVVLVAHGDWVDVAGPPALISARNQHYDETIESVSRPSMADRIDWILSRARELSLDRPLGEPAPATQRQEVSDSALFLIGSSVVLIVTTPLRRALLRRWRDRRAARLAFRGARADAFASLAELGARLSKSEPSETTAAAAERHATATMLFERATTAEELREVKKLATRGSKALTKRADATRETS